MTPCTIKHRLQYSADRAKPHHPEMTRIIKAWNRLSEKDKATIENTMRPIVDLPGVGGLVALELAAKLGMFLVKNRVSEL